MRKIAWIACFILTVLMVSPLVIGIYFKHYYYKLADLYGADSGIHFTINQYKKGWFSSDATVTLQVTEPHYVKMLEFLEVKNIPKKYIINQHIQHGPFFYSALKGISSRFGFAAIHNQLQITKETKQFLEILGINPELLQIGNDLVTFGGNYFKHVDLSLNFLFPGSEIHLKLKHLVADMWTWPFQKHLTGKLSIEDLIVEDQYNSVSIPKLTFQFDQDNDTGSFWMGKQALHVPEIVWFESGKKSVSISDVNFKGFFEEISGVLVGNRQIDIHRMQFNNYEIGPLHLQVSIDKLNKKAIADMFSAYQQILQRGELYQYQLQQKMYMMLPSVIEPGSTIKLDAFNVTTPEGKLHMNGKIVWNLESTLLPEDLSELLRAANANLDLRISKELIDKWIYLISDLPLLQSTADLQKFYTDARRQTYFAMQQNSLSMIQLVNEQSLPEKYALNLMDLQNEMIPLDEYNQEIQKLVLNKTISLDTSYKLSLLYTMVKMPLTLFKLAIKENQEATRQGLQGQLLEWLKDGYIKQDEEDYVVSILQEKSGIKVNEKSL